jgi:hypothetical protein
VVRTGLAEGARRPRDEKGGCPVPASPAFGGAGAGV